MRKRVYWKGLNSTSRNSPSELQLSNHFLKMWKKHYVTILTFCCILSEGIGNAVKDNSKEPSDFHSRRKRLIDNRFNGNKPKSIVRFPYVVSIQKNGMHTCTGIILEPHVILAAAHCIEKPENHKVLSGSGNLTSGILHKIKRIIKHPNYLRKTLWNDLMLLVISPNIDFENSPNDRILLFNGDVPPNTFGTISSWGCIQERRIFPTELRSISVPIISLKQCREAFKSDQKITEDLICTLDPYKKKRCSHGDSGSPLVVNGRLVGVMSWSIEEPCWFQQLPDVFVNLSWPEYSVWIRSNIPHDPTYRYNRTQVQHPPRIRV